MPFLLCENGLYNTGLDSIGRYTQEELLNTGHFTRDKPPEIESPKQAILFEVANCKGPANIDDLYTPYSKRFTKVDFLWAAWGLANSGEIRLTKTWQLEKI